MRRIQQMTGGSISEAWLPVRMSVLGWLLVGSALAAPRIDRMQPHAMQRGTEQWVHLYGGDLLDPQDVIFYLPGLELIDLEAHGPNHVAARLLAADECQLGPQAFRLCTGRGISNLCTVGITDLPVFSEVEPNNGPDAAQPIDPLATVLGTLVNEDLDCFAVDLTAGQSVSVEVEGIRLGRKFVDPVLQVLGPSNEPLVTSDDTPLTRQDPWSVFTAPESGRYVIQVRDARYRGNDFFQYLLHIGRFPRPTFALPAGGPPGASIELTRYQPGRPSWKQLVALPNDASPSLHDVFASNEHGTAPTPNQIRIVDLPNHIEVEPNNRPDQGTAIPVPTAVCGVLESAGDVDYFRCSAQKGQKWDVRLFARCVIRSPLDAVVTVQDASGKRIASNDDTGGPDSYVEFTAPADGDYLIRIHDHLGRGGPQHAYRLEIAPRQPTLIMRAPERERYVSTTASLPRGNRMAVLVSVEKRNFNAPVEIDWGNLPPALTAQASSIPAGRDRVPVLFTASADAHRGGSLIPLIGRAQVGDRQIEGGLSQRTLLVRGNNNRDMWGHDAKRLAVAVTDEAPCTIEIVPPRVPLVRSGSMDLRIVAHRDTGCDAPITVRMLYNPPGVSSRGSVTIPGDQSQMTLPLTANGNAALGSSPIVITAVANHAGASYEVASQLVDLEVADALFGVEIAKASVEQGQEAEMMVTLQRKQEFAGPVRAELVGLPAGTSSEPQDVPADATELRFRVKAETAARPGRFNTVICRLVATQHDEPITHVLGRGQLRVDKPLPVKPSNDGPSS